jgi:hypothetical protein
MKNILIPKYNSDYKKTSNDLILDAITNIEPFLIKHLDKAKSQAFLLGFSSDTIIDSLSSSKELNIKIQKMNHERIYEISKDSPTVLNFGAGSQVRKFKEFILNIMQEVELRKHSNQHHCPVFIVYCGSGKIGAIASQKLGSMNDSWRYNVFFINISILNPLSNYRNYNFLENHDVISDKDLKDINFNFTNLENSIVLPSSSTKEVDFEIKGENPIKLEMSILTNPEKELSIEQYLILLKKDLIYFKNVPMVVSNSKEECILILEEKMNVLKLMSS